MDGKESGYGLIYSTSEHLYGGLKETMKKSVRKLSPLRFESKISHIKNRKVNSVTVY
jgi:hypothetical protein